MTSADSLPIRPEVLTLLDAVEHFAQRTFLYRPELEMLVELSFAPAMRGIFDDLIFYAKFATQASLLLAREGPGKEETEKLSKEFIASMETVSGRLRTLFEQAPAGVRESIERRFMTLSPESFSELLGLATELSWIKNYEIDTHRRT